MVVGSPSRQGHVSAGGDLTELSAVLFLYGQVVDGVRLADIERKGCSDGVVTRAENFGPIPLPQCLISAAGPRHRSTSKVSEFWQ